MAEYFSLVNLIGENWNNFFDDLERFDTEIKDFLIEKDW